MKETADKDPLKFYRARQLAELLNVSRITIFRWASNGTMPKPIKLSSGVTGWRATDIAAWLAEREASDGNS